MSSADRTRTTPGVRTVLATAILAVALAGAANARADPDPVDLTVVDRDTGQALPVWRHHGRLFVAGEPGARYALRVTNHTDGRVLLVMSVDGVNVVTGETARYDQRGYVLAPYGSFDVNGWRKSNSEVAAFAFAALPQSYAARTGRPGDVGVIGMAVFQEKVAIQAPPPSPPPVVRPQWRDEVGPSSPRRFLDVPAPPPLNIAPVERPRPPPPAPPAPSALAGALRAAPQERPDEKLGTAHGAREWSVVGVTTFDRATPYPLSVREIEYDTYDNLVASGVIRPSPYAEHRPRAFPWGRGGQGFVPDPPPEP